MNKLLLLLIMPLLIFSQDYIEITKNENWLGGNSIAGAQLGYVRPTNAKAIKFFNLGHKNLNEKKNVKKAIKYYKKAIKQEPSFVQAFDRLGYIYTALENYDLANHYYQKSLNIFSDGYFANYNLGVIKFRLEEYDTAIEYFENVIKIYPNAPSGYHELGRVFLIQKKYTIALNQLLKSLELYKKNPPYYMDQVYWLIGETYYYLDEENLAITFINMSIDLRKESKKEEQYKQHKKKKNNPELIWDGENWVKNPNYIKMKSDGTVEITFTEEEKKILKDLSIDYNK